MFDGFPDQHLSNLSLAARLFCLLRCWPACPMASVCRNWGGGKEPWSRSGGILEVFRPLLQGSSDDLAVVRPLVQETRLRRETGSVQCVQNLERLGPAGHWSLTSWPRFSIGSFSSWHWYKRIRRDMTSFTLLLPSQAWDSLPQLACPHLPASARAWLETLWRPGEAIRWAVMKCAIHHWLISGK